MSWLSNNLGWLIGTKEHCRQKKEAGRPLIQRDENDVDHARRVIAYEDRFSRSYWSRACIKRMLIVVIIIMLFTNPGFESFKVYVKKKYDFKETLCRKKFNLLIFSAYNASGHNFVGAFNTFFLVNFGDAIINRNVVKQDSVYRDTSKKIDTFKKYFEPIPLPASLDTNSHHDYDTDSARAGRKKRKASKDSTSF